MRSLAAGKVLPSLWLKCSAAAIGAKQHDEGALELSAYETPDTSDTNSPELPRHVSRCRSRKEQFIVLAAMECSLQGFRWIQFTGKGVERNRGLFDLGGEAGSPAQMSKVGRKSIA